ncbi:c-type cytochrome [Candidatus Pseudothioglobus singularis]|nr:c-type cytochrome [Candidatus Pseudothioglobus singularis]
MKKILFFIKNRVWLVLILSIFLLSLSTVSNYVQLSQHNTQTKKLEALFNQVALEKFLATTNKEKFDAAIATAAYQSKLKKDSMETLELLSERMEMVSKELRFATTQIQDELSFDFLPICSDKTPYITDRDLGLKVDIPKKTIKNKKILELVGLDNQHKVVQFVFNPTQFNSDAYIFQKIFIDFSNTEIVIGLHDDYSKNSAHPVGFTAVIEGFGGGLCKQDLRLFLSPKLDLPEHWEIVSSIGKSGRAKGRFSLPYGTEIFQGNMWSTDCANENISVFDLNGHFIDSFSSFGSGLGKLNTPADIKIRDEKVFVVEELNHRVQIFSINGNPIKTFGSFGKNNDTSLAVDKFDNPLGISVTEDLIVVVDSKNKRVMAYDRDFNFKWMSNNKPDDSFEWEGIYYIDYSPKHELFLVSNQTKSEIGVIDKQGNKVKSFGHEVLRSPFELAVTKNGDLLVGDTTNHRIVLFDGENDFSVKEIFPIPDFFGLPKTIGSIEEGRFVSGMVGNGVAYFLVFENTKLAKNSFENISQSINFGSQDALNKETQNERSTEILYDQYCSSCHENGKYGAPARRNYESWEKFPKDMNELLDLAKKGKGAMNARGGCSECSDEELLNLIKFIVPENWY